MAPELPEAEYEQLDLPPRAVLPHPMLVPAPVEGREVANAVRGDSVAFLAGPRNSLPTNRAAGCGPTKRQRRGRAPRLLPYLP